MTDVWQLLQQGGPVMVPLLVLSLVMYEACLHLLLRLTRVHRRLARADSVRGKSTAFLRTMQTEWRQRFAHDELVIGALIAAAPLLGLLGTVMGMVSTFDTMALGQAHSASGGLAAGISMALITTETGLAIAIPAVILMYYAQRQLQRVMRRLAELEDRATAGA